MAGEERGAKLKTSRSSSLGAAILSQTNTFSVTNTSVALINALIVRSHDSPSYTTDEHVLMHTTYQVVSNTTATEA